MFVPLAVLVGTLCAAAPVTVVASANGAALAWEMGEKLKAGVVDEAHVLARLDELDDVQLGRFLDVWRMGAPAIAASVRIRAEAERRLATIELGPAQSRQPPREAPVKLDPLPPEPPKPSARWVEESKSPQLAVVLSIFAGFGLGNFYVEAYGYGTVVGLAQLASLATLIVGAKRDIQPMVLTSLGVLTGARLADSIGAGWFAYAYNDDLRRRLGDKAFAAMPAVLLSVPLVAVRW